MVTSCTMNLTWMLCCSAHGQLVGIWLPRQCLPCLPASLTRASLPANTFLTDFIACSGVERIIITSGNLEEARAALALARTDGEQQLAARRLPHLRMIALIHYAASS